MTLKRHIRRLLRVHGYDETILADPRVVREALIFRGVTPTLDQVRTAIVKHFWFITAPPS